MSAPQPCPQCGAPPKGPPTPFCTYCGAPLAVAPTRADSARMERASRLEAVARHPDYRTAMTHEPDLRVHMAGGALGVGCFAGFAVVTGLIALLMFAGLVFGTRTFGPGGLVAIPFVIVPLLMCAIGAFGARAAFKRTREFVSGEWDRRAAIVRDERTVTGDESSSYFVTLEFAEGRRDEFGTTPNVAGNVVPDDAGIAYLKGGYLVDFRRMDV